MALDERTGLSVELDNGAFDVAGVDGRALDVSRFGDAADGDREPLTTMREQKIVRFDADGNAGARGAAAVAKHNDAIAGLRIDFARHEGAPARIDGGMAGEAVTGDRPKDMRWSLWLLRIDDCCEAAG